LALEVESGASVSVPRHRLQRNIKHCRNALLRAVLNELIVG